MQNGCSDCTRIVSLESTLDTRATALAERVNALCREARDTNRKKWEAFAEMCRNKYFGDAYFSLLGGRPFFLVEEPEYSKKPWYRDEGRSIEDGAHKLEGMKKKDLVHWGDERVEAYVDGDHGGKLSPQWPIPRREAYRRKLNVFIPDRFDFHSLAGAEKMSVGQVVMDCNTKQIVPELKCGWQWSDGFFGKLFQRGMITYSQKV